MPEARQITRNLNTSIRRIKNILEYVISTNEGLIVYFIKKHLNADIKNQIAESRRAKFNPNPIDRFLMNGNLKQTFEDLLQVGREGLQESFQNWDSTKGAYSTYSYYLLLKHIAREMKDQGTTCRVPSHVYDKIKLFQEEEKKQKKESQEPKEQNTLQRSALTENAINPETNSEKSEADESEEIKLKKSEAKKQQIIQNFHNSRYLYNEVTPRPNFEPTTQYEGINGFEINHFDTLPFGADTNEPMTFAISENLRRDLRSFMGQSSFTDHLKPREYDVLVMRYGLDYESPKTQKEKASILGVSNETIKQNERTALAKIRRWNNYIENGSLRDYLDSDF
jgi:RNA polymerase primary sigma factor